MTLKTIEQIKKGCGKKFVMYSEAPNIYFTCGRVSVLDFETKEQKIDLCPECQLEARRKMIKYKINFEFKTEDFVDELDLKLQLEKLFPYWTNLEVKEKNENNKRN